MSRRLWINAEVRDWLSGLRTRDPSAARLAGEAVLGLLEESPGPPLAVPADLLLWTEDPSAALEFAYQRRLAALRRLRRPAADVATARKRLELRVQTQEAMVRRLGDQSRMAAEAGRHDIAQETRERQVDVEDSLSDLRRGHAELRGEEEKALRAIARRRDELEVWRTRMEKARVAYLVRHGGGAIESALAEAGEGPAVRERPAHTATAAERSAIEALLEPAQGLARESAEPAPHLHELRLGPLTGHDLRILFAVESPGAVHLLAAREGPGEWRDQGPHIAEALLRGEPDLPGGPGTPGEPGTSGEDEVTGESFLEEFFPGEAEERRAGAARLLARNRAHALADVRCRRGLTREQVAGRMSVTAERVAAIEGAEPGALEIGALAAYLEAIGGRLEIVADLGTERVNLR